MQNLQIHYRQDELLDLLYWKTDTVIPFSNFLCWVNYYRGGILFCDVFEEMPKLVYLWLPIADRPRDTSAHPFFDTKRSVCVTEAGLKFVDVSCEDGELSGPMELGTGFTITCHTLKISESGDMKWDKDFSITSKDLWACNSSDLLPRSALMYPLVSMDRPHLVHFLLADQSWDGIYNVSTVSIDDESRDDEIDKVFSVSIDMTAKAVVSILPYIEEISVAKMLTWSTSGPTFSSPFSPLSSSSS
jgi:hypothetical protein